MTKRLISSPLPVRRWKLNVLRWTFALLLCLPFTPAQAETVLLHSATVHTVSGETFSPGQVLIADGKILAVAESIPNQPGNRIDLTGLHLYPGLIAANSALGLVEIGAVRATLDMVEVGGYTPDVRSWLAINPDSELLPVARANGITHFQPVPSGGIVNGLSGVMQLQGWTSEEMTVHSPAALHLTWPSLTLDTRPKHHFKGKQKWKSLEDQAEERRARLHELNRFFSEAAAYAKARQRKTAPLNPAWEAMTPFLDGRIPLVVHADELRQIRTAIDWAATNQLRIILAGARDAWHLAGELASNNIPVIYEHVFTLPATDTDPHDIHFKAPGLLQRAGVKLIIGEGPGSDAASNARNLPYSAAQAITHGLPESEALKAITLNAAEILGLAHRLGSIEAGKEATLIATDGGLFDIRSNVKHMWIGGHPIDLQSRHTRLYNRYKARPAP